MERAELIRIVQDRVGTRQLIWVGTRGDDAEGIGDVDQFAGSFSLINRYERRSGVERAALEDRTGERVDLDTFDVDDHLGDENVLAFRRDLLGFLSVSSVVFTYRPTSLLSSVCFARQDRCEYAGLFRDHQAAFEHKPWVESAVARLEIPRIKWHYIADEEQARTANVLRHGPVLLRRSRTNGGTGLTYVNEPTDVERLWPDEPEAFASVATFHGEATPVNVSAVAWKNGVTLHPASIQLIGIPQLTTRQFGYCGNDFAAVSDLLTTDQLDGIQRSTLAIGDWLRGCGYRGAYGVDFLVVDGEPRFMEVNPRFQGSTRASCQIAIEADESCLMLEHLAALLDVGAPPSRSLRWFADLPGRSHVVVHWTGAEEAQIDPASLVADLQDLAPSVQADVLTRPDLLTKPGATIGRFTASGTVTRTGFDLDRGWLEAIEANCHTRAMPGGDSDGVGEDERR